MLRSNSVGFPSCDDQTIKEDQMQILVVERNQRVCRAETENDMEATKAGGNDKIKQNKP